MIVCLHSGREVSIQPFMYNFVHLLLTFWIILLMKVFATLQNKNILHQQLRVDRKAVGSPVNVNNMNNQNFMNYPLQQAHSQLRRTASAHPTCGLKVNDKLALSSNQQNLFAQISVAGSGMQPLSIMDQQPAANLEFHRKLDRSMSEPGDRNQAKTQTNSSRYKTEMCRPFEENGTCKYGDKCQFAHGAHELRNLSRHPKYKTELCRTFHTIGFCPYGPRCHFIHNPDEMRTPPPSPVAIQPPQRANRPQSLSTMNTFSLGSVADSPTSSLSTSPVSSSPTLFEEDPFSMFTPPSFTANRAFTFPQADSLAMKKVKIAPTAQMPYGNLSAFDNLPRQSARPPQQHQGLGDDVFFDLLSDAPSSPTQSLSDRDSPIDSPLDISRGLRLPIFSQLSINDD